MTARPPGFRGIFRDDAEARAVYAEAAGIARIVPSAVAVPADADDVVALVRWARQTSTPLVPRGAGSSMAGGAIGPGVIVDLSRMREIETVDVARRRVRAGPGASCAAIDRAAAAHGLRFPVDPSSAAWASVGGMAATNAAGAHTLRHGSMRRWVTALDCVFDDGTRALVRRGVSPPADVPAIARLLGEGAWLYDGSLAPPSALRHARVRKDSSGYGVADYAESGELVDLLVGSEGTLALFVGVEVALAPRPAATSSVLAAFATLDAAVDGAVRARDAGAVACELLDRTFLDVAAASEHPPSLPRGTEAVLLAEVEATSPDEAASLASTLGDAFTAAGASHVALALEPKAEHALWELRHAASPTLARLDPALKSMQFIEDACVPAERLAEYVRGVRAALATQGVRGVIFGHAGDAHMHVNPLVDVRRPEWRAQVESLFAEVSALVVRLGGTLSGEHGDGRLRAPLVRESWGHDAANVFGLVKEAFDPSGILNPGVKLPVAGQRPIEQVKYDPALPPLAPAARRALDLVADRRAYAEFRLDLLDDEQRAQRDQLRQP